MANTILVTIPKSAIARETTSKKGTKLTIFALSGEYEGYEFMLPSDWLTPCEYDRECVCYEMYPNSKRSITLRVKNESTNLWETVDSKELDAQELNALFERAS